MTEQLENQKRGLYSPVTETPTAYRRERADAHPPLDFAAYKSTALRHPKQPLIYLPQGVTEVTGPQLGDSLVRAGDDDLTRQHEGEPIGERITVSGRVLDTEGKPLPHTLVEIWQANAAGRYRHVWDRWPAPLDPNFDGAGRCVTDEAGRYTFITIKPGAVPVGQPLQRLAPGAHPLLAARPRVRAAAGHADVLPRRPVLPVRPDLQLGRATSGHASGWSRVLDPRHPARLGARVRVRHRAARPGGDSVRGGVLIFETTPSQTVGPYFAIGLPWDLGPQVVAPDTPARSASPDACSTAPATPIPDFLLEIWQADPDGRFADAYGYGGPSELAGFRGFGRSASSRATARSSS